MCFIWENRHICDLQACYCLLKDKRTLSFPPQFEIKKLLTSVWDEACCFISVEIKALHSRLNSRTAKKPQNSWLPMLLTAVSTVSETRGGVSDRAHPISSRRLLLEPMIPGIPQAIWVPCGALGALQFPPCDGLKTLSGCKSGNEKLHSIRPS